ncbi:hypothetical protein B0H16DRAFT_1676389 [Mycena metata]|uniref:Uncharacterized protein n=1 Tax=Mycena metata TaxID=1033252 RepID=A0AAD7IDU9_9AGAR|nr:hypothetical protein B0H16DRAFT_1676389 [Mycena metata]
MTARQIQRSTSVKNGLGNGSGTGGAAARLFAKEGYAVALISRGSESLNALASSIKESGGQVRYRPLRPRRIAAVFSAIHEQYSSPEYAIKVAIFNIGQTVGGPLHQLTAEDIRESNKINIESSFAFARGAILAFQQNEPTSSTGKGTLVFTSLAKEFGQQNIHAIIDGGIAYLYLVNQDRAAWTWELDLRPAHEKW